MTAVPLNADNYTSIFPQPELDEAFTKRRFHGKVAIVTGGASGIGRATVERFCNDGASVAIIDVDATLGLALQDHLRTRGRAVKFYLCDVSNRDQCIEVTKQVATDNGGVVNYLINNAADFSSCFKGTLEAKPEDWQKTFMTNVYGISNMTQVCFPFMKNDGKRCAIVNVASISGHVAQPVKFAPYQATKGATLILTKCMALDLSEAGIRVNSVSPGLTWTPSVYRLSKNPKRESHDQIGSRVSMINSQIEAAGVAAAITFLCSEDAKFIDGADLAVDGGYGAMGPEGRG